MLLIERHIMAMILMSGSDYIVHNLNTLQKILRFGVFDDNDKLLGQVITFSPVFLQTSYVGCIKDLLFFKNNLNSLFAQFWPKSCI